MKIFKYLFFLLLLVIIAGSIYIATKDGEFQLEETKTIAAPQEVVYAEVNNYENWENWEPWSRQSENMVKEYREKTRGEDAGYSWKSDDMGDGEIHTLEARPFSFLGQEITFHTPFGSSTSDIYWEFEEQEGDSTQVTWGMKGKQSFMEKLAFVFQSESLDEMMRPMFQEGLNNIETSVKNKMEKYSISVDGVIQHGGGYYMYSSTATKISRMQDRVEKMFADVENYMNDNNIEISGNPVMIFDDWKEDEGSIIFSGGYFTPSQVVTPDDSSVLNGNLPNQRVLRVTLKGDYKNLTEARNRAYDYIEENGLEVNAAEKAFGVYKTRKSDSANPADWVTQLHIPLEDD